MTRIASLESDVVEAVRAGLSRKAAAQQYGVSYSTIQKVCQRAGLPAGERGFAVMTDERKREIAQMGGREAHRIGRAHQWSKKEARAAARISVAARKRKAEGE